MRNQDIRLLQAHADADNGSPNAVIAAAALCLIGSIADLRASVLRLCIALEGVPTSQPPPKASPRVLAFANAFDTWAHVHPTVDDSVELTIMLEAREALEEEITTPSTPSPKPDNPAPLNLEALQGNARSR